MATMDAGMMRHHIRHDAVDTSGKVQARKGARACMLLGIWATHPLQGVASDRFCVGTAFTTLGSKQSKEVESGKPEQRTTHGGYVREDARVPDHPAREEFLDLFGEYAPEVVMEAYCSQSPGGMQ